MIKGINKQIIEMKCSDNEFFDKILFFVRSERSNISVPILQNYANSSYKNLLQKDVKTNISKLILTFITGIFIGTIITLCIYKIY